MTDQHMPPLLHALDGADFANPWMWAVLSLVLVCYLLAAHACESTAGRVFFALLALPAAWLGFCALDFAFAIFTPSGQSVSFFARIIDWPFRLIVGIGLFVLTLMPPWLKSEEKNISAPAKKTPAKAGGLASLARRYGIAKAAPGERAVQGFKCVDHDAGGEATALYGSSQWMNLEDERRAGRLYGTPGVGLESSGFGSGSIGSGRRGEETLARMIAASHLNVIAFYSLYGRDAAGSRTDADIDCVLLGADLQGHARAWFVDAKNYKGGSDTRYVDAGNGSLARISKSLHAFVSGSRGSVTLPMSGNMAAQRAHWEGVLRSHVIASTWCVCMTPTGEHGAPDASGVAWPGSVPAWSVEQLVSSIRSAALAPVDSIRAADINLFRSALKGA